MWSRWSECPRQGSGRSLLDLWHFFLYHYAYHDLWELNGDKSSPTYCKTWSSRKGQLSIIYSPDTSNVVFWKSKMNLVTMSSSGSSSERLADGLLLSNFSQQRFKLGHHCLSSINRLTFSFFFSFYQSWFPWRIWRQQYQVPPDESWQKTQCSLHRSWKTYIKKGKKGLT